MALLLAILNTRGAAWAQDAVAHALAVQQTLVNVIARSEKAMVAIAVWHPAQSDPLPVGADPFDALLGLGPGHVVAAQFGGGIIISRNAATREVFILTAAHLLSPAISNGETAPASISIRTATRATASATIRAADPRSDLAILQATLPEGEFAAVSELTPGDADQIEKGHLVVGIGNPWGLARDGSSSASLGMVSNIQRRPAISRTEMDGEDERLELSGVLLQLDMRLDPGMSGAAVVNLQGRLVGMVTALATPDVRTGPVTFAIPMSEGIQRVLEALLSGYEAEYGFLGVSTDEVAGLVPRPVELRSGPAVRVHRVADGSPGDRAGLRSDDLIYLVNGRPVYSADDLTREVALLGPGAEARLLIYRPNTRGIVTLSTTLGKWPVGDDARIVTTANRHPLWRGMRVDYATSRKRFLPTTFFSEHIPAVVVTEVVPESPAAQAGLKVGELIAKVGEQPVETPQAFYEFVTSWPERTPLGLWEGREVLIDPERNAADDNTP